MIDKSKINNDAINICKELQMAGHESYLVGGCIRDLLLNNIPKDWDIATNAKPNDVIALFENKGHTVLPIGLQHGTVTVLPLKFSKKQNEIPENLSLENVGDFIKENSKIIDDNFSNSHHGIEITTYRGEGDYTDGRHPDSVYFVNTIEEDLSRRDFTMNALAYDPLNDKFIDPFNGINDISLFKIKAVGNPNERFSEDGLRIMRAVRFASKLGFAIDSDTEKAFNDNLYVLEKVSKERINSEFFKILESKLPYTGLNYLLNHNIYPIMSSYFSKIKDLDINVNTFSKAEQIELLPDIYRLFILLKSLSPKEIDLCLRDLKCSNEIIKSILNINDVYNQFLILSKERSIFNANFTLSKIKLYFGKEYKTNIFIFANLFRILEISNKTVDYMLSFDFDSVITKSELKINGNMLIDKFNIKPGKIIGNIMDYLFIECLHTTYLNNEQDLLRLSSNFIKKQP